MDYTHLGRAGVLVSRLCLGTMNFGPYTSEADSFAIMDRALEAGINFFDTANVYGRQVGPGATEGIIGRWLAQGGRRDQLVLATKVYGRMGAGPNEQHLSAKHIKLACEASLQRLQTDYLDLYQMHHVDRGTPWDEVWEAMEQLRREGKVLYIGSSNFAGWHIAHAQELASQRHFFGLVSEQSLYNLLQRSVELEVIPACEQYGLGLLPWSPLAGGLLGGGLLGGVLAGVKEGRRHSEHIQQRVAQHREALEGYEALCAELGQPPAAVAQAWLLQQPGVTAPIIGPRTMAQLDCALATLDITLDDDTLAQLDALFPGPGGPAPEAYAW